MTHTSGHNSLVLLGVATVFCAAHTPLSALGLVRELLEADRPVYAVPTWHASEVRTTISHTPPPPRHTRQRTSRHLCAMPRTTSTHTRVSTLCALPPNLA